MLSIFLSFYEYNTKNIYLTIYCIVQIKTLHTSISSFIFLINIYYMIMYLFFYYFYVHYCRLLSQLITK